MTKDDYGYLESTLRELSLFIAECKAKEDWKIEEDRKAHFKRLFYVVGSLSPAEQQAVERERAKYYSSSPYGAIAAPYNVRPLPNVKNEASQLDIMRNKNTVNSQLRYEKGDEELIKLKYGQGSISIKIRYNKKGTIYKIYQGRYRDEYGKYKSVYGKTQKECLKKLREANPTKKNAPVRLKFPTLQEWMLSWYNDYKKSTLRLSTQKGYEANMNTYIFPALGKIKLCALTTETLQHFFTGIHSGNTRKKLFLFLSACLKKAVVLKKLQSNPCDAVELPKYKKKKRRPFEYEEQNKILSAEEKIAQVFFFLCVTGLRMGEFLALTKEDFYFEQNVFRVDKAIAQGVKGETKTEAGNRNVFFLEELFEHFDINLLGTFTYHGLRSSLARILKKHNISGVSWHCTRHTYATVCHSFGMNDKVLQEQLGHSTLAMTQDVYTHLLKKGTSKIRDYLDKLCTHICRFF